MTAYFWDSSALAALLFDERFSPAVREYNRAHKAIRGYVSFFSELEMESVFQRKINRGDVEAGDREEYRSLVRGLLSNMVVLNTDGPSVEQARRLISEYSLRAADALQLAAARALLVRFDRVEFLTFDEKLNRTARAEGLGTPFLGKGVVSS